MKSFNQYMEMRDPEWPKRKRYKSTAHEADDMLRDIEAKKASQRAQGWTKEQLKQHASKQLGKMFGIEK